MDLKAELRNGKAGVRHLLSHAAVSAVAHDARLIGIARNTLGMKAIPFHATLFSKLPDANWLVAWHQDKALPVLERRETPGWGPWSVKENVTYAHATANALHRVLALRLHLDDSTECNGPLRVLPRTHMLGVLCDDAIRDLAAQLSPQECFVPRGGILAMRPLLVHASSKSQMQVPRRVLHIEYAESLDIDEGLQLAVA